MSQMNQFLIMPTLHQLREEQRERSVFTAPHTRSSYKNIIRSPALQMTDELHPRAMRRVDVEP